MSDHAPGIDEVLTRIDTLTELFMRRLLDDREKRILLAEAQAGPFRQVLHPMVVGLAQVIDRLDDYTGPDRELAASIRDDLLTVLDRHGVHTVDTDGALDLNRHEVAGVEGRAPTGGPMRITRTRRRGFHHGDWVFRPAQVVVAATTADE